MTPGIIHLSTSTGDASANYDPPKGYNTSSGLTMCQKRQEQAAERAQQVRTTTALAEAPSVIPSDSQLPVSPALGVQTPSSGL